jgi:hypothetical protein
MGEWERGGTHPSEHLRGPALEEVLKNRVSRNGQAITEESCHRIPLGVLRGLLQERKRGSAIYDDLKRSDSRDEKLPS